MKVAIKLIMASAIAAFAADMKADVLSFWNFNSNPPDFSLTTGTTQPFVGDGTVVRIGTVTESFNDPAGPSGTTSDPDSDNSCWRLSNFPTSTSGNKTSGAEFSVSTAGYENITASWDHFASATGSRYWRVQYSTDGTSFVDHTVITALSATWFPVSVDFGGIPATADNPNFKIRIVSEFQSTATGSGTAAYVGAGSTYGTGGTLRLDMVTFSGSPVTPNVPPTISPIGSQTTRVDTATSPIPFTVNDAETPANELSVSGNSSDPTLVQSISFGGSGNNRTVTCTPEAGQTGTATITIRVTDGGGKFTEASFTLTVLPANTPPNISKVSTQTISKNSATPSLAFTVSDLESAAGSLTVSGASSDETLVPLSGIMLGGSGENRTVQVTPAANRVGVAVITLTVSDGAMESSSSFAVRVLADTLAFWDFNSNPPDGDAGTGTLTPVFGSGSLTGVGGVNSDFVGTTVNSVNDSSDPATSDNSGWRLGGFPGVSSANKTAGAEMSVSTEGYAGVTLIWDQLNSIGVSRYFRVQYSFDGTTFQDYVVLSATPTNWNQRSLRFPFPEADNNPNFKVRFVSEFELTATGSGLNSYIATRPGTVYGTSGVLRMDMLTFTANPLDPSNSYPLVSAINNHTTRVDTATSPIAFSIWDAETAANDLVLSSYFSNPALIENITFGGSGGNRTVVVTPKAGQIGTATVYIAVTDADGKSANASFVLTVLPQNTSPFISAVATQTISKNSANPAIPFTVSDLETPVNDLQISVASSDESLLPLSGIVLGGSGADRTLQITPANKVGVARLTITVSDGEMESSSSFVVRVIGETLVFWDFNSNPPDDDANTGSITPVSGFGTLVGVGGVNTDFLGTTVNSVNDTSDPTPTDNSGWRVIDFPAVDAANKTAGAEFSVSTEGHAGVTMVWEQLNSIGASRYWRVQYSVDGTTFHDHVVITATPTNWFQCVVDFPFSQADNNPNFKVRILSEFESTATGSGSDSYITARTGSTYNSGALRFDMVTFTADLIGGGQPSLDVTHSGTSLQISWPASATDYILQTTASLASPNWQTVTEPVSTEEGRNSVTLSNSGATQFFRLVK